MVREQKPSIRDHFFRELKQSQNYLVKTELKTQGSIYKQTNQPIKLENVGEVGKTGYKELAVPEFW
jgi:hypothetical protein